MFEAITKRTDKIVFGLIFFGGFTLYAMNGYKTHTQNKTLETEFKEVAETALKGENPLPSATEHFVLAQTPDAECVIGRAKPTPEKPDETGWYRSRMLCKTDLKKTP